LGATTTRIFPYWMVISVKQLLLENCIRLDDKLFNHEGRPYTVKNFIDLLKERGTTKIVKKKILHVYGKRFEDKEEVLSFIARVAKKEMEDESK
jgi:hypothetical protein